MAIFVNNKNVDSYNFIQNDEIRIIHKNFDTKKKSDSFTLKCPTSISNAETVNGDKCKKIEIKQIRICSVATSNCGNLIVACDSNNFIHLWKREKGEWKILSTRNSMRKCQKVIFTNSCAEIILADRGGDVFEFSVLESTKEGKFLLGHISFITDISISPSDEFLATCDRDGKIRVSSYPNCYSIQSYCLGHSEFVSSIYFIELNNQVHLLSGSGDGILKLWEYKDGVAKVSENMSENTLLRSEFENKNASTGNSPNDSLSKDPAIQFSVLRIKFCQEYNLIVIIYHFVQGIAVYKIQENQFHFIQFLNLPTQVLDVLLADNGNLLVLKKHTSDALCYFTYSASKNMYLHTSLDEAPEFVLELQNFYGDFKDVLGVPIDEQMLFKKLFDCNDEDDCKSKKTKLS